MQFTRPVACLLLSLSAAVAQTSAPPAPKDAFNVILQLREKLDDLDRSSPEYWKMEVQIADILVVITRDQAMLDEVDAIAAGLIERDPESFDGHRFLGDLAWIRSQQANGMGDRETAAELVKTAAAEYQRASRARPDAWRVKVQLARIAAQAGNWTEVEQVLQAVGKVPFDEPLYYDAMRAYQNLKKPQEVERVLKEGMAAYPKQANFPTSLASHYLAQGRREDAVAVLNEMLKRAADYDQVYASAGDLYARMGRVEDALRTYREGVKADEKNALVYQRRVIDMLDRTGKRAEAAALNAQVLKANPEDPDALGFEAAQMLDRGEVAQAVKQLEAVVARAGDRAQLRLQLGRAYKAAGRTVDARREFLQALTLLPSLIRARVELAQLQLGAKEYEAALKSAEEIANFDRTNQAAGLIRSASLMGLKRFDDAAAVLRTLERANPKSPDVAWQMGLLNSAQGKFDDAVAAFRKLRELEPANVRGITAEAEVELARKRPDAALALLKGESEQHPGRNDLRVEYANLLMRAGRYDLAATEYRKLISMVGERKAAGELYARLGETTRRAGKLDEAIVALEQARKLLPDSPVVLSMLGLVYDASGRTKEAISTYEAGIRLDPANGTMFNNLAFRLADSGGDLDNALTYAIRARQLLPEMPETEDTLGFVYLKQGQLDAALPLFKELVEKRPESAVYRYHFAEALARKGERAQAIEQLRHALGDSPARPDREKIEKLLKELKGA